MTFKKLSIIDSCDDSLFETCLLTLSHLINEFLVFSENRTGFVLSRNYIIKLYDIEQNCSISSVD